MLTAQELESAVDRVGCQVKQEMAAVGYLPAGDPTEEELWVELASCILSSRVGHAQCQASVERIRESGLSRPWEQCAGETSLTSQFECVLRGEGVGTGYRFPAARAKSLAITAGRIYGSGGSISSIVLRVPDARTARALLMDQAHGIGPKQASLFLVNAGLSDDLAILDQHVVNYLKAVRFRVGAALPTSDLPAYEKAEEKMRGYARTRGFTLSELDLAIWLVMRAQRRRL
jgi:N-glycosylase/DNA lyase